MGHVYISYSRQDSAFAHRLAEALRARHISVWYDVESMAGGADWSSAINRAISDADAVVAILSPHSVASKWIQREHEYAIRQYKPVFPVMVQDTRLPPELAMIQYIDARSDWDRAVEQLVHILAALTPAPRGDAQVHRESASHRERKTPGAPPVMAPPPAAPVTPGAYEPAYEPRGGPRAGAARMRIGLLAILVLAVVVGVIVLWMMLQGADADRSEQAVAQPTLGDLLTVVTSQSVHQWDGSPHPVEELTHSAETATHIVSAATQLAHDHATAAPTSAAIASVTSTPTTLPTRTAAAPSATAPAALQRTQIATMLPPTQAAASPLETPAQVAALNSSEALDSESAEAASDLAAQRVFEARVATAVEFAVAGTTTSLRATDESGLSLSEAGVVAAMITKATTDSGGDDNTWLLWAFNLGVLGLLAVGGVALLLTRTRRPFRATAHSPAHPVKAPAPLPQDYQLFISSSDADKAWVSRFVRDLTDMGYVPWWYAKDAPGLPFGQEIVRAIFYTKIFVVVVSPDSMESKHVEEEIRLADRFDRPIITVIYRPTDERLYGLAKSSDIDFSDERDYKGAMEFLTQAFNHLLERHRQAAGHTEADSVNHALPHRESSGSAESGPAQPPIQAAP